MNAQVRPLPSPGLESAARELLAAGEAAGARVETAGEWVAARGGDPASLRRWVERLRLGLAPLAEALAADGDLRVALPRPAGLVEILETMAEAAFGPLLLAPDSPLAGDHLADFARRARRFGLVAAIRPGAPFPRWAVLIEARDEPAGEWSAGSPVLVAYALDPGRIALVERSGFRAIAPASLALGEPEPAALAAL